MDHKPRTYTMKPNSSGTYERVPDAESQKAFHDSLGPDRPGKPSIDEQTDALWIIDFAKIWIPTFAAIFVLVWLSKQF